MFERELFFFITSYFASVKGTKIPLFTKTLPLISPFLPLFFHLYLLLQYITPHPSKPLHVSHSSDDVAHNDHYLTIVNRLLYHHKFTLLRPPSNITSTI